MYPFGFAAVVVADMAYILCNRFDDIRDNEAVKKLSTMTGPDEVVASDMRFVAGLERKVQSKHLDSFNADFGLVLNTSAILRTS